MSPLRQRPLLIRPSSFVIRHFALALLALIPLLTLIYKDDCGRWEINRSLMAAPDEFSYMLTAQSILHGDGISTQKALGLDTFYPPGYPLLLAAWSSIFGLTPFSAHVLNAVLLSLATLVVYFFSRRLLHLLAETAPASPHLVTSSPCQLVILPLLIAALFATNWTVLESALYVFSEPVFMLVTFAWLALTLKWRQWHFRPGQTAVVALLAIAAWSIRGAGLVCIAVTIIYPVAAFVQSRRRDCTTARRRVACIALILALGLAYQVALAYASPDKSLFSSHPSSNSYPHQLLGGITQRGALQFTHPADWAAIAARVGNLAMSHVNNFAESFTPWLRDPPDYLPRYLAGRILALLALAGFVIRLVRFRREAQFHVLHLYLLFYFLLYLLWPFNMIRFWSPILPIMLAFIPDTLRFFLRSPLQAVARPEMNHRGHRERRDFLKKKHVGSVPSVSSVVLKPIRVIRHSSFVRRWRALLFTLLLILNVEELFIHLGDYQRRINYVSDSLAASAATVVRLSPDPQKTTVIVAGDDEHFIFAWYFHQLPNGSGFLPQSPQFPQESPQSLLQESLKKFTTHSGEKIFILGYFTETNFPEIFANLRRSDPALMNQFQLRPLILRPWDTAEWEFIPAPFPSTSPPEK